MSGLRERWRKWWGLPDPSELRCFQCRIELQPHDGGASLFQNGRAYFFCADHVECANDVPFF